MIPAPKEFLIKTECTECDALYHEPTEHWVNFLEWDANRHMVLVSLECDVCATTTEVFLTSDVYNQVQEYQFPLIPN